MGTADTPAAPINGLIGVSLILFIIFAINTPQAVPIQNATAPKARIPNVSACKNLSALILEPTDKPLMHAMGPNVAGVIGSAVAAGVLLSLVH
jgi:Na+-transporting methylmalonyl-CoA/oxaloacetate decarboxylase beta subunit